MGSVPLLIWIIKRWDWKVHSVFFILGFLIWFLHSLPQVNNWQTTYATNGGVNPDIMLLGIGIAGGFVYLLFDIFVFYVITRLARMLYPDWSPAYEREIL